MSVDRLNNIITQLNESRKDRYLSMFRKLESLGIPAYFFGDRFELAVDKVMEVLKKDSGVVWLLRLYRLSCLQYRWYLQWRTNQPIIKSPEDVEADKLHQFFLDEYHEGRRRAGLTKVSPVALNEAIKPHTLRTLGHYLSLGIPEIDNYVFTYQRLGEVLDFFAEKEASFIRVADRQVDISLDYKEGAVDLIKLEGGWKWIDLNRPYCEREAKAMGHCGNKQAGVQSTDTILSLREPLKNGMWRPHATFILKKDGTLGEMKGYANSKPDAKYHHYIVELLKLPIIKGLVGGGYRPKNNFNLSDLNKNQYNEVIAANPGLSSGEDE
jgi:hypothetical protein